MKSATDRFFEAIEAAEVMFGEMLRPYILRAVVCVLFGIGIGFGWHFVDRAGGGTAALAITSPAKQDAPNPPPSNPPAQREGPVLDVPRVQVYPRPNNQLEAWRSTSPMRRSSRS